MKGIFPIALILGVLFSFPSFAAKIESISGNNVTIFLESIQDENVKSGEIVHLINSNGRKMAELKITENRGLMADAQVISGNPNKSYKVLMPHMIKKAPPPKPKVAKPAPKPKPKPVIKVAPTPKRSKPKVSSRSKVKKKKPRPKPRSKPRVVRKKKAPEPVKVAKPKRPKSKPKPKPVVAKKEEPKEDPIDEPTFIEEESEPNEEPSAPEPVAETEERDSSQKMRNWNVSMDILSLAGLFFDYQIFGFMLERRLWKNFSIGAQFNFGTFETNEEESVADRPILRRNQLGLFIRYSFSQDALGKGLYTTLSAQSAQENWVSSTTFPGATESGMIYGFSLGYQWVYKSVLIRLGYGVQTSSFEKDLVIGTTSYERSSPLLSGMAHYALLQVGVSF